MDVTFEAGVVTLRKPKMEDRRKLMSAFARFDKDNPKSLEEFSVFQEEFVWGFVEKHPWGDNPVGKILIEDFDKLWFKVQELMGLNSEVAKK